MLLNPTHQVTYSGLRPDLLEAYIRYKTGTRAITAWLLQHGSSRAQTMERLAISDMISLADKVSCKRLKMPDVIDFYFRETIAARKFLSKSFRKQEDDTGDSFDTVNHEHFTSSLSQIYTNLCECCGRSQNECKKSVPSQKDYALKRRENPFNALVEDLQDPIDEPENFQTFEDCLKCSNSQSEPCHNAPGGSFFVDDGLSERIEFINLLQQMEEIRNFIVDCWTWSVETPLSVAACLTNTAMVILRELACRIREIDEDANLEKIQQKCHGLQTPSLSDNWEKKVDHPAWHNMLEDIRVVWHVINHYATGGSRIGPDSPAFCVQKPSEHLPGPNDHSGYGETQFLHKLMQNILQQITITTSAVTIEDGSIQLIKEFAFYITDETNRDLVSQLQASLTLHIISKSYQAHFTPSEKSQLCSNPRLQSLRHASTTLAPLSALLATNPPGSPTSTFPCRCPETLAHHLSIFHASLYAFTTTHRWDLLAQSPWVCGNQVLEIQQRKRYFAGCKLMRYRGFVGAVVHVYNALRYTGGLEAVPELEAACENSLFWKSDERPIRGFRGVYMRWLGGRLKFKRGCRGQRGTEGASWCLAVPSWRAREGAGLGVDATGRGRAEDDVAGGSLLDEVVRRDYRLGEEVWVRVFAGLKAKFQVNGNKKTCPSSLRIPSGNLDRLRALRTALLEAENQNQNKARPRQELDFCGLYSRCVQLIERMSDHGHEVKGSKCLCFVEGILRAADRVNGEGGLEVFSMAERAASGVFAESVSQVFCVKGNVGV